MEKDNLKLTKINLFDRITGKSIPLEVWMEQD